MIKDSIQRLEASLSANHPDVLESMAPGTDVPSKYGGDIKEWFAWRNGRLDDSQPPFFGTYFFSSYDGALSSMASMRKGRLPQVFFGLCFARKMFHSMPLVVDGAGGGYYFNTKTRSVFYRFEGERDAPIGSVESFINLLVMLSEFIDASEDAMIEFELSLHTKGLQQ